MVFKTQLNETPHLGYVTDFDDDSITIDTNPILLILNKDVSFLIELEEVEEPSADIGSRDQYNYSDLLLSDDDSINIFP